ncbi:MAG: hypothetical protein ACI9G1_001752 [Pirellulaceae bacterium]|jgi:hypothetical protein
MNYKLPILTIGLWLGFSPLLAAQSTAFTPPTTATPRVASNANSAASGGTNASLDPVTDPQQLVKAAAAEVYRLPSVEAKTRQIVQLYGHRLSGAGMYRQLANPAGVKFVRLEMKMSVADKISTMVQVCDGERLWIRRDLPTEKSLGTVNLRLLEQALQEQGRGVALPMTDTWMALGGLSKMLEGLHDNFEFKKAEQGVLNSAAVWNIQGRWKPARLAEMLGTKVQDIPWNSLPPYLPHRVSLTLARDPQFPLFPYRVEYFREVASDDEAKTLELKSVVLMELFEVRRRADLDPRLFRYEAGNQDIVDLTDVYLEKLKVKKPAERESPVGATGR